MVVKFIYEAYRKTEANENFRFLFLTHNTTARDLVDSYVLHLDSKSLMDANTPNTLLQTDTLLNLAYQYLAAELTDIEPVSIDAHVGKTIELDFISDIIADYRRGAWW
jgi:hypothetical protein